MADSEKITFLNFDNSLTEQKFLQKFPHHWIDCSNIPHTNGFCEHDSLEEIRNRLTTHHAHPFVLIGNGNYHYVTYLLMERVKQPFSLVLFDHHDDMMDRGEPLISCGSWVAFALRNNPYLEKVCLVGVNEQNMSPVMTQMNGDQPRVKWITEQRLQEIPLNEIASEIRTFLGQTEDIYISIDKDVLYKKEAFTNWDQGNMTLVQLLYILETLVQHYLVTGMDICGEYLFDYRNEYDSATWEYVKMNELVNRTLIEFIHELDIEKPYEHSR